MSQPVNAKSALIRGAVWMVATRWSIKGLGFFNTIIMARLLLPSEYGVVAMAMLTVGLVQAFLEFGAHTALLRKAELTRAEIDSAWTLRTLQGLLIAVLLIAGSPLAAMYFQENRVMGVLWVLGVCIAISSAANIGMILAQKAYDFALEFRVQIFSKIFSIAMTLVPAYFLRDYRALVIGMAAGMISGSLLSYVMHPYRPKWDTSRIGEIWAVTKWLMVSSVGGFVLRKGDELIAGRIGTSTQFGLYNVGSDLGQMPTAEVGPAMLRGFLPVLSAMKGTVQEVNAVVLKTMGAANSVTMALGLGCASLATPITALLLGPNWGGAAPFVAGFAIIGALQSLPGSLNTLLVMRGHTKVHSKIVWIEFVGFVVASTFLVPKFSLIGLVWARGIGVLVGILSCALYVRAECQLSLRALALVLARPLFGALLMAVLVRFVSGSTEQAILQVMFGVAAGAAFYVAWCLLSWHAVGRPESLESTVLDFLNRRFRRKTTM